MRRTAIAPRSDWQDTAARHGFDYHTIDGLPYWVEDACYVFTLDQIERDLERPTNELMAMCLEVVERAHRDDEILASLRIPEPWWPLIRDTWERGDKDLYARMDLAYDGQGPAKLLEINGDTPTALYEAAFFQWLWLEQAIERGLIGANSDQFNSLQEALIDGFATIGRGYGPQAGPFLGGRLLHLTCVADHAEDLGNVRYLQDCASQAGLATELIFLEDIGVDGLGRLTDLEDRVIEVLFKLYPWEFLIEEEYGIHLRGPWAPQMIEPAWKMVLSNKGVLPWLWWMFPGHPNLLPACFAEQAAARAEEIGPRYVIKPLLSREGANIRLIDPELPAGGLEVKGPYGAEGTIVQTCRSLPIFRDGRGQGQYPVIGSWVVAGRACGIGIREDDGLITRDSSRFLPHRIE
ncbi:putative acid--amine ligase YgiC [uncultured Gammaproteobacteria bacterium]